MERIFPEKGLEDRWSIERAIEEGRTDEEIVEGLVAWEGLIIVDGEYYGPHLPGNASFERRRLATKIAEIRAESGTAPDRPSAIAAPRRGRPHWTRGLFAQRLDEATRDAERDAREMGLVLTDRLIAAYFRPLSDASGDAVGIDVSRLRDLRRKARLPLDDPEAMPEG